MNSGPPKAPNPNATIQIDADALADLDLSDPEEPQRISRATPPPLPPEAQASFAPPAPEKKRPWPLILALFAILLAAVIFAGMRVGQWLRPARAAEAPSALPVAPAGAPSTSASAKPVITIPTIEMNDTPQ